jgi:exodeoxyribonuclease V alpha subunit
LGGLIERVTFHSDQTGFAVLRVKVVGHRDLVTLVGTLPSVTAGEWVEARGRWVVDREHGQQFKAEVITTTQPNTAEGIEKYLGSGMVRGIGPAFAKRLVNAFGEKVFDIIEKEPARLREVAGIGPVRQERLLTAWAEQKMVREIMVFLHSHGVGTSRAFRIYKTYGDQAILIVTENPYRLAHDIWGIGFKTADQIAERLGVDRQSDIRARAGVEYVLGTLTDDGHCAFPRDGLTDKTAEMLEIPPAIVERAIDYLMAEGRLVQRPRTDGAPLVYLASLNASEEMLARNLTALAKGPHPCPSIDVEKALTWVQSQVRLTFAAGQQEAIRLAIQNKVLVITGGPGVGKTTIVNAIVRIFAAKKLRVVLGAPTGRAAKRLSETTALDAKTIHRLLEFDPKTGQFRHGPGYPLEGDVFVVDETSMIDLVLAHQLVRAIPLHAGLILVGDVDQLPSVGPGMVLRDVIESGVVPVCRQTEVFRQAAQSHIITNAHRVNRGDMPVYPRGKVADPGESDFYFIETPEPEEIERMLLRLVTELIPQRFGIDPVQDIQVLTPMQRGVLGARNLNQRLQESLNPNAKGVQRFGLTFRVGDKVMQVANNYEKEVFNGDIGRIIQLDDEEREAIIEYDGRAVTYSYDEFDELTLSYAVTIHKSQGSEYPCVVMPIHTQHYMMLQRNLLYTGITRGKKLVVLVGSHKAVAIAVKRVQSHARITTLQERLREAAQMIEKHETTVAVPLSMEILLAAAETPMEYGNSTREEKSGRK